MTLADNVRHLRDGAKHDARVFPTRLGTSSIGVDTNDPSGLIDHAGS